jgi:hypothetical protein
LVWGTFLFTSPTDVVCRGDASGHLFAPNQVYLITPSDNPGMSQSVSVGLTLNSEWNNDFRSAQVLGCTAVPSLVDADGYFFSARNVHLLTYRQLIAIQGLLSVRRREG